MLIHPAFWLGAAVVAAVEFWPQISKASRPTGVKVLKAGLAAGEHIKKSVSRAKEGFDDMVAEAKAESAHEHHAAGHEPEESK
jgi:hypothetical protein